MVGPYEVEADTSGSQRQEHDLSAATLAVEIVDNAAAKLGRNLACVKRQIIEYVMYMKRKLKHKTELGVKVTVDLCKLEVQLLEVFLDNLEH